MKPYAFITSIVLALGMFAFSSDGRGGPLYARQAQAGSPKVSAEFEAEVSQLTGAGLRLKEAVDASLEGTAHHLAAIF